MHFLHSRRPDGPVAFLCYYDVRGEREWLMLNTPQMTDKPRLTQLVKLVLLVLNGFGAFGYVARASLSWRIPTRAGVGFNKRRAVHLRAAPLDYLIVAFIACDFQPVFLGKRFDSSHWFPFRLEDIWRIGAAHVPKGTRKHRWFNEESRGCVDPV